MNILHKILLFVLIIGLSGCNNHDKLSGTWISAPVDTVFTTWDISNGLIISNQFSPDKVIAKYIIKGNKIIIDSGAIVCNTFYIPEQESLTYKLRGDKLSVEIELYDTSVMVDFSRTIDLLLNEKLLPEKLLNIDLPHVVNETKHDSILFAALFIGKPKTRLLNKYQDITYIQINDVLTNPGNSILEEYISYDTKFPIEIYCDKETKMIDLDSLRYNLLNYRILFGVTNLDFEIAYLETNPYYYCNCVSVSNTPPPIPLNQKCKHLVYNDKAWNNNIIKIDSSGEYSHRDTIIQRDDISSLFGSLDKTYSVINYFIQYDNETRFEEYIQLYSFLQSTFNSMYSASDLVLNIIDMNEKDIDFISSKISTASW